MATRLFTDSTSDLTCEYIRENHLNVVCLTFHLDGEEHVCVYTPDDPAYFPPAKFYARMRAGSTPTTAQVNCQAYTDAFEPVLLAGDDIFYVAFSSGLSGSYNSACLAARDLMEKYPERSIRIVDSRSASMGEGMVVYLAAQKLKEGVEGEALEKYVEEMKLRVHHWFTVDDLVYLKRGGRVSATAAVLGTMLNIKPMLNVDDEGHLIPKEKIQGRKRALKGLVDHMAENVTMPYTGPIFLSHCDCEEDMRLVEKMVKQRFDRDIDQINFISPIIGAHSGPGTVALFFVGDQPRG